MSPFDVIREWLGWAHDAATNEDKIWAAAYTQGGYYLSVWGRRGTTYNVTPKMFATAVEAGRFFDLKVREKRNKGYESLPFSQSSTLSGEVVYTPSGVRFKGGVPSFHMASNPYMKALIEMGKGSVESEINEETLIARMELIAGKLRRHRPAELASVLIDFQVMSIQYSVWSQFVPRAQAKRVGAYVEELTTNVEAMLLKLK